jgi:signal transduction histidine kinase/FixJ family two-component response regulator/HPt (histidine-containing phosphotransfer) domain-containing protein
MSFQIDVLDKIDIGIAVIGKDERVLLWNKFLAERSTVAAEDIIGKTLREVFGDRVETHLLNSIQRVLHHGWAIRLSHSLHPRPLPLRLVNAAPADQHDMEMKQAVNLMTIPLDGGRQGCVIEIKDVTETVQRKHSLREQARMADSANLAKSRFLASITHELRTPLHGILGYAELLGLEGGLTALQSQRIDVMMAAGQHLLAMVNSVLDMSQIEADQLELHAAPVDLSNLVNVCLDVMRPAADAKNLTLSCAPAPPVTALIDVTRLRQVVLNLLGNAVKFTPQGGVELRLHLTQAGHAFRLEIADTGPGVPAQHHAKLFQTFERLNAEAVSAIEGSGLGLAITARLVDLMGGRIGYEDNPGGGSIFWLELPVGQAITAPQTTISAPATPALTGGMRVLVADDEALNRSIACEFLRSAGHDVVCVNDGIAAVKAAAASDFDVILMDVRMPGMNGLEATRLIRDLPAPRSHVCVVAVTAQAFAQQIDVCLRAGMDLHVAKPFKQSVLLAALDAAASFQRSRPSAAPPPDRASGSMCNQTSTVLPVFDQESFESVIDSLPPDDVIQYLQGLTAACTQLLPRLNAPSLLREDSTLAEDTHRLAGNAGVLGFPRIAAAARNFEVVATMEVPEKPLYAQELASAIESSILALQRQLALITAGPGQSRIKEIAV